MAREFNINFNNVEMIDDMDNFLEETQITKVTFEGENKIKSLNSTFKNCPQLSEIEDIDLSELEAIDCMLEGSQPLIVSLINVNNVDLIIGENSLTTAQTIIIKGDSYNKVALQNVIGSLDWLSEQYVFEGTVGEDVFETSEIVEDTNTINIEDTLEQRTIGFEILGQTYNNEIKGKEIVNLIEDVSFDITEDNNEIIHTENLSIVIDSIEGNTYQNLVNGKIGVKLDDYCNHTIDSSNNIIDGKTDRKIKIIEMQGETKQNLNITKNKTFETTLQWYKEITEEDNSFETEQSTVEITEIWGNTENINNIPCSVGELCVDELDNPILDENGDFQYLLEINSYYENESYHKKVLASILLPQPLRSEGNVRDRMYWDYAEECYYLEKKVDGEDLIKLQKLNNKIQLKIQQTVNISVNSLTFPQKIVLTNEQSVAFITELNSNKQYSIHLKARGNKEENTITPTDLSLLSYTLDDYVNMVSSDITLSDRISINANKGITNASCAINFSKLFETLMLNNFQFSCDFSVNSLSNNGAISIQGGFLYKGFEVKGNILNTSTGHLTVTYDFSSKTCSIVSTGAIPINTNTTFGDIDIENSFKIISQNCNITYSNISLTTDGGIYIGEGENKIPIPTSLEIKLGEASEKIRPLINGYNKYIVYITTTTLSNNNLELFGDRIKVEDVVVIEGQYNDYLEYFEGVQSVGVPYNDEYLIELLSNNYDIDWEKL